jgi:hypothetical protein
MCIESNGIHCSALLIFHHSHCMSICTVYICIHVHWKQWHTLQCAADISSQPLHVQFMYVSMCIESNVIQYSALLIFHHSHCMSNLCMYPCTLKAMSYISVRCWIFLHNQFDHMYSLHRWKVFDDCRRTDSCRLMHQRECNLCYIRCEDVHVHLFFSCSITRDYITYIHTYIHILSCSMQVICDGGLGL